MRPCNTIISQSLGVETKMVIIFIILVILAFIKFLHEEVEKAGGFKKWARDIDKK